MHADAAVDPEPEREVMVRRAVKNHLARALEGLGIEVRGGLDNHHFVAPLNQDAVELDVLERGAHVEDGRWVAAQVLIRGGRPQLRPLAQLATLLGW